MVKVLRFHTLRYNALETILFIPCFRTKRALFKKKNKNKKFKLKSKLNSLPPKMTLKKYKEKSKINFFHPFMKNDDYTAVLAFMPQQIFIF
ncbi:hypothetical protein XENTR_v10012965 [Xenopus tropicalis]|nr:hypothetical protein XENTR_v10012965 [Xenopus tropicalis]